MVASESPEIVRERKTDEWTQALADLHARDPLARPGGGIVEWAVLTIVTFVAGIGLLFVALHQVAVAMSHMFGA
jgi:hypothetical protein